MQPTWLVNVLAGLMVATSLYCLARLLAARAWKRPLHRDTNIVHMADAVAMAGMLVGGLRTLPDTAWEVIFGFFTLWFAVRAGRTLVRSGIGGVGDRGGNPVSHYLSHLTMAGAMLYMFFESSPSGPPTAARAMSAMGGGGTSNLTELTLLLVIVLFGSAVWHADSLTMYATNRSTVGAGRPVSEAATPQFAGRFTGADTASLSHEGDDTNGSTDTSSLGLAPRLETACHIALCVTMGYMLIILL